MANTSSYDIVDGNRVDNPTDDTTYVFSPSALMKSFTLGGKSDGDTVAIDAASTDFRVKFKKNAMTLIGRPDTGAAGVIVKVQFDTDADGGDGKLVFLDGTIDVSFQPNVPGGLKGVWTFGGIQGAKKLNLNSADISYTIDGSHTYAQAATAANAALNSQTLDLTVNPDDIVLDAVDTVDTVRGIIDFDVTNWGYTIGEDFGFDIGGVDNSTFNLGDTITGNGNTRVELTLDTSSSFLGGEDLPWGGEDGMYIEAEYVEMSGIDELALKAGSSNGAVFFDASTYGNDISKISLTGRDGMFVDINNLQADETLDVSLQTGGGMYVSGEWNDLDFDISLNNSDDSSNSSVNLTAAAIAVVAGNNAFADLHVGQSGDTVDNITLGTLSLTAGKQGEVDAYVYATADSDGSASVGNLTVGNVSLTLAKSADDSNVTISMSADADDGSATVGNLSVGSITVNGAENTDFDTINLFQYAYADSGDATIGNRTVGDINVKLGAGDSNDGGNVISISQSATASGEGNATIGNTKIGNISITAGDEVDNVDLFIESWAYADTGNATIGDTVIGNIAMNAGKGDGSENWFSFSIMAEATVDVEGDASVGDLTIGNITQIVGDAAVDGDGNVIDDQDTKLWAYAWRNAESDKGNASVGDLTVGNVIQTAGDDQLATFEASQSADAVSGDATIGNLTVGNLTTTLGDRGEAYGWIYQWGDVDGGNLVMGDLTVGNVDMRAQVDSTVYFSVEQTGDAHSSDDTVTIGNTKVGNVNLAAGADSEVTFGLYVTAYNESDGNREDTSVGNVTVGNVAITAQNAANVGFWNDVYAGKVGNIGYGNVDVKVGENSQVDYFYISASASTGDVGNFTVGNVTVDLDNGAYLDGDASDAEEGGFDVYAYNSIGNVTIGNQTVNAATDADFGIGEDFEHHFYADNGSIGAVNLGAVALNAIGEDADIDLDTYFWAEDSIKSVKMGNVAMAASGEDADSDYEVFISSDGEIGDITVGNVSASAVGEDANGEANFYVWADNDIGNVKFGNIVVNAENEHAPDVVWGSANATVDITITGSSDIGNITVGSVTMTAVGEDADSDFDLRIGTGNGDLLENIGDITIGNLSLMASGSSADVDAQIYADSESGDIGLMKVGNIDITVANTEEAQEAATVSLTIDTYGDLTVGNISLTQGDMTDWGANDSTTFSEWNDADMYAYVELDSWNGDLVVGDITVTGGYLTSVSDDDNDNYGYLGWDVTDSDGNWLHLYADGTITVGNIDYSGYERFATIDVSEWLGAANIKASQGGSDITDNAGQNTITLGDGADTVYLLNSNGDKDVTVAANADVIIDFDAAEDLIDLEFSWDEYAEDESGSITTYGGFLAAADTADKDIYAIKVGSDIWVALDSDDDNTVDFVVKLAGLSTISESDFTS